MTHELSRQEVASWKRVIRVISHELNNSLAPISPRWRTVGQSCCGAARPSACPKSCRALGRGPLICTQFLSGYTQFAKLPQPHIEAVDWSVFLGDLAVHQRFVLAGELPRRGARFDAAQIEQALINLIKNAHEAGGPAEQVSLCVECPSRQHPQQLRADRFRPRPRHERGGTEPGHAAVLLGPSAAQLAKPAARAWAWALSREIVEAHGGRITLAKREGGGMLVSLVLPLR